MTKVGVYNLFAPTHQVASQKPLVVRAASSNRSDKVETIHPASGGPVLVHILELRSAADGSQRALIARKGQPIALGWVTSTTKEGARNLLPHDSHAAALEGAVRADRSEAPERTRPPPPPPRRRWQPRVASSSS